MKRNGTTTQKATFRDAPRAPQAPFPRAVYLVLHLPTNSYGCVDVEGLRGIACFSDAPRALQFAAQMPTRSNLAVEMPLADAREVALSSRPRVPALILADDPERPLVRRLLRRRR